MPQSVSLSLSHHSACDNWALGVFIEPGRPSVVLELTDHGIGLDKSQAPNLLGKPAMVIEHSIHLYPIKVWRLEVSCKASQLGHPKLALALSVLLTKTWYDWTLGTSLPFEGIDQVQSTQAERDSPDNGMTFDVETLGPGGWHPSADHSETTKQNQGIDNQFDHRFLLSSIVLQRLGAGRSELEE